MLFHKQRAASSHLRCALMPALWLRRVGRVGPVGRMRYDRWVAQRDRYHHRITLANHYGDRSQRHRDDELPRERRRRLSPHRRSRS